jgi:hypothetical protein
MIRNVSRRGVMRHAGLVVAVIALLAALPAGATAATPGRDAPRVVLALLPASERPDGVESLRRLEMRKQIALGYLGPTQGRYVQEQALLDITQGTRVGIGSYTPREPPQLGLVLIEPSNRGRIVNWEAALARAETARATVEPGLLASKVPGGAGFAGSFGTQLKTGVLAADRRGNVARVSMGEPQSIVRRTRALLATHRFVVADLPFGTLGGEALNALLDARRPNELLIAMQTPPDRRSPQLLPIGIAGLGSNGALTSVTTQREGIVAGIDILPTVLDWLGVPVPDVVTGRPMTATGERSAEALRTTEDRLQIVGSRRIPAFWAFTLTWLALLAVLAITMRASGFRRGLRIGGLAVLWIPTAVLITAALRPERWIEINLIALLCVGLAVVTDLFIKWPRGPVLPAAIGLAAYTVDLATGSDLIVESILGPNPRFGSRYYGLGNELESTIPILGLALLAAALASVPRSRKGALTFAGLGLIVGAVIASGRLGAAVGGVFTVGIGYATATLLMLPRVTKKAIAAFILVPVIGLAILAAIDLLSGGQGHFSRNVLDVSDPARLWDTVVRRYQLALAQFGRGLMPLLSVIAVLLAVYGIRYRKRLFEPVRDMPAWQAAIGGAAAGSVAGALFNDSGPVLLVFGMFGTLFLYLYMRGDPGLGAPTYENVRRLVPKNLQRRLPNAPRSRPMEHARG